MLRIAFEFSGDPMQSFLFLLLSIGVMYMLLIGIIRPSDEKKEESDEFAQTNPLEDPYAEENDDEEPDDTDESAYTPLDEPIPERSGLAEILRVLTPRRGHFATPILLDLNLLVFLCMVFVGAGFSSFETDGLLSWGANYRPLVLEGECGRLLTSLFLHGGLEHLIVNMLALLFIGFFLEPVIGAWRFALSYLLTGLAGSLSSIWWHPLSVSVGASGAILGMYGVAIALLLTNLLPGQLKRTSLLCFVAYVCFSLLSGLTGNIDNAAHIGGLLSGIFVGLALYPGLKANVI
ncbi:MAG: rhomboid family intramembrane serine protease [Bacteroidales bacterium]|nr:rhomboid family intramembrane serine protease [Bacteroidales bacterium]